MVIEYQKRMLPHAHIMFIIHPDDRHKTAEDIDKLVSAGIPREPTDDDNEETREYLIRSRTAIVIHMTHGPCGAENPRECIAKSVESAARETHSFQSLLKLIWILIFLSFFQQTLYVCGMMACGPPSTKKIPMSFVPATLFADSTPVSGRATLRRRPGITTTLPNGKEIDTIWIVSYIIHLLLKYVCHINVVVCTSVNLIKYLYKYKG
jgi:hypothetical protein